MKKRFTSLVLLFSISFYLVTLFTSCTNDVTPSLYDEEKDKGLPVEITSLTPAFGFGGVTDITITGKNFASKAEDNFVYFNSSKAKILSASESQLIVKAPVVFGDSLKVKISKTSVELYSNTKLYKLESAVNEHFQFLANQEPYVATVDKEGNIYFSYIESAKGKGVYKLTTDGTLSEFAPKGGETTFSDLKYHSGGYLIGVWGKQAIFKIEEGKRTALFVNTKISSIKLNTFDFDKDTTIWAGGKGGQIVSAKQDKSFKLFDYEFDIAALRVFNNYLYAISGDIDAQNIVRFPIVSPDSLGNVETYFEFSSKVGTGAIANSLAFSADGQMYIGTSPISTSSDPTNPILFVNTDGSFGVWYSGLITSNISSITWGTGTNIYVIRNRYPADRAETAKFPQSILKIDMERLGAPEFGRDL